MSDDYLAAIVACVVGYLCIGSAMSFDTHEPADIVLWPLLLIRAVVRRAIQILKGEEDG